jgi:uncharacterized protein YegP (UPF0339 family)
MKPSLHFKFAEDAGKWRWILCSADGHKLYAGKEIYPDRAACVRAMNAIKGTAPGVPMLEVPLHELTLTAMNIRD